MTEKNYVKSVIMLLPVVKNYQKQKSDRRF